MTTLDTLTVRPTCRHCGHDKVNRPRGLCWTCFYKPDVRELYASTVKPQATQSKIATCLHCQQRKPAVRGLCAGCYDKPGVRERYPKLKRTDGCRGHGGLAMRRPLPEPTTTRPGTEERLAVLAQRAALEQQLWHPDDAKL